MAGEGARALRGLLLDRVKRLVELHEQSNFTDAQKREWDVLLAGLCVPTVVLELARLATKGVGEPIPVVIHCPRCRAQHIDGPDPKKDWDNPPHKSHLCHKCGLIWRTADVPTTGVASLKTVGDVDNPNTSWGDDEMAKVPLKPDHKIIRTLNFLINLAAENAKWRQARIRDLSKNMMDMYVHGPGSTSHESSTGRDCRDYPSAEFYRDLAKMATDVASYIEQVDSLTRIKLKLFGDGDFAGGQDVLDRIVKGPLSK